ncbi:ABC transporter permease [Marinomonas pollencensis]|uniref:Transport permease protein n=1 Tax=Marinomonas pollencensis TaxID=491954 RepID=A0A3E0D717_9GAMM|nr:ABC transporter permease [Marinomonas pollencensis]REG78347.1 lipopolysaccharide transport system permease protein [Marinomonas pollencensis]
MFKNKLRLYELIWVRATLNLKSEASVNRLSYAWWIIEPLLHMAAYYFVFAFLLDRGDERYVAFLLTGLVPWLWFSKSVNRAMSSVSKGASLMNQLHVPKVFFPLTCLLQDSLKQVFVFMLLFLYALIYGAPLDGNWLWLVLIVCMELVFIYSVSLVLAIVIPFLRDLSQIVPALLQFMMFCSGIFFSYKSIPEELHEMFFINPMAVILRCFRDVLVDGIPPPFSLMFYVFFISVVLLLLSYFLYKKFEYKLSRVVLE